MKQSHKKIKFQIESEIEHQDIHEHQNVQKLNNELKISFNNYQEKRKKQNKNVKNDQNIQHIFQNAIDDFNVRFENVPETHSIIDFKNNVGFVDMATDMEGFQGEV